jgi:peptide/nickel transport system substrate-binding protein
MLEITKRQFLAGTAAAATVLATGVNGASAQDRRSVIRYVTPNQVNTLDPVMLTATQESVALSVNTYDRLLVFDRIQKGDYGVFDFNKIKGELAESYEVSADGLVFTFHLRQNAKFHDGTSVSADDVKWSLERAVSGGNLSKAQMETGSITADAKFEVIDKLTFRMTLARADRLALANLATIYAPIYNSTLAKQHATPEDPWANAWLQANTAGGGAYTVERYVPGQQVSLKRYEDWVSGKKPAMERVILQTVPDASTRRNLIERGDADLTLAVQTADFESLEKGGKAKVAALPMPTAFTALVFNTKMAPFDNVLVRQALAAAMPYDALIKGVVNGRGGKLYDASWTKQPDNAAFPQPMPNRLDLDLAKRKLTEAGFPKGFETTLSYGADRAELADLAAPLIQEALAKIGVNVKIEKMPAPQFAEAMTQKTKPLTFQQSLAYFPSPEYFFRVFLSGPSRWNFSSWANPDVDKSLPVLRYEPDAAKYDAEAKRLIGVMAEEEPMVLLWAPTLNIAMSPSLKGFTLWYHRSADFRELSRE